MRVSSLVSVVVMVGVGAVVACGDTQPPPQTPAGPGATGPAAVAVGDAGPTTTTTQTVGGGTGGAKLTPSAADAGLDGSKKHPYELGRGLTDIEAIIAAHRDEARACYDKALLTHPDIQGNLDVRWTVDPSGAVTSAEVDTSLSDILEPAVGNCVTAILKKIHFNASAMRFESKMHYRFNFRPHPHRKGVDGG
jgi:hypothetical protein